MSSADRVRIIKDKLIEVLDDASGIDLRDHTFDETFFDVGMDSLILTQVSMQLERAFNIKVSFRSLMGELSNINELTNYVEQNSDFGKSAKNDSQIPSPPTPANDAYVPTSFGLDQFDLIGDVNTASIVQLFQSQIALLERLGQGNSISVRSVSDNPEYNPAGIPKLRVNSDVEINNPSKADNTPEPVARPFGAIARISRHRAEMTAAQSEFFKSFVTKYTAKTKGSKEHTQKNRATHADPRVVTGFKPHLKEIIYPIVVNKSKGSHLWDVDGNKYVDLTCGFGSNFFGNMPDWLEQRLISQIKAGVEIGPQHELAGSVADKLSEYIGHDRVAFCNTGSEAVLGAVRIARTVTGREKVVTFTGSYHGIIDEVIVRGSKSAKSFPAAPGIMPSSVVNTLVLDYGADESLDQIQKNGANIAAVLVESVQSRRPDFRPAEFLKKLRAICDERDIVLIFDEIITGIRMGRFGAQGYYNVKADLATYGKVIGAGISVGVIAGKRTFMDALDGGTWAYGDQSVPEVGVTYFAGTFVRHPLALAAMDAVLDFLKSQPDDLAARLDRKADEFVSRVNQIFETYSAPWKYVNFGSMMKLNPSEDIQNLELLVYLLRLYGVHIWDGFPNFLTLAHSEVDIATVVQAFERSVSDMSGAGFFGPPVNMKTFQRKDENDQQTEFRPDPLNPGQYIQVKRAACNG